MKLGGIAEDKVYASNCRIVFRDRGELNFCQLGQLPNIGSQAHSVSRFLQTNCVTKAALTWLFGSFPTTNIWPVNSDLLYATRGNHLFRSDDAGGTWTNILRLPKSSGPMGVLPTGFCETNRALYLGEYPLDNSANPSVLQSNDGGETWKVAATPAARHVHAVTTDPFTGDCWVTTGDSDDESMLSRLTEDGIEPVGTGSQLWRAVDLAFTPNAVLWGMDCPYAEKNRIVRLKRSHIGANKPPVETLHTVESPVYFADTIELDGEYHVFFSTAIEPATRPKHVAQVLHGSTADGFETWRTLATFQKRTRPLDTLIDTNAYVFLAAHPERGLFINPYNTESHDGEICAVSVSHLRQFGD